VADRVRELWKGGPKHNCNVCRRSSTPPKRTKEALSGDSGYAAREYLGGFSAGSRPRLNEIAPFGLDESQLCDSLANVGHPEVDALLQRLKPVLDKDSVCTVKAVLHPNLGAINLVLDFRTLRSNR